MRSEEQRIEDAKYSYAELVGGLLWGLKTRIDTTYAVNRLTPFMANWDQQLFNMAKRIIRYLKLKPDAGLVFKRVGDGEMKLSAYVDAAHRDDTIKGSKDLPRAGCCVSTALPSCGLPS